MIDVAAVGDLAPAAVEMFGDLDASAEVTFGSLTSTWSGST